MLLPYTAGVYYGPACAAMVVGDSIGEVEAIQAKGDLNFSVLAQGTGAIEYMRLIRLRGFPLTALGTGEIHAIQPRMAARMGLDVKISELSQDDVVGALQTMRIEGDMTFVQAMRAILAVAAGNATGLESSSPVFKAQNGTTNRIKATYSGGNRTITTLDLE